ncbi:hypothetical protein JOQ06_010423, partial [Pogonophryne albipinna]
MDHHNDSTGFAAAHTSSLFPSTLICDHAAASSACLLPNGALPRPASAESPVSRGSGGEAIFWGQGDCASGTAARCPTSPEAKECPLFLLLLPASLTLHAHALSGTAGASARPGPSRPAGHLGRLNLSTLTWTCT